MAFLCLNKPKHDWKKSNLFQKRLRGSAVLRCLKLMPFPIVERWAGDRPPTHNKTTCLPPPDNRTSRPALPTEGDLSGRVQVAIGLFRAADPLPPKGRGRFLCKRSRGPVRPDPAPQGQSTKPRHRTRWGGRREVVAAYAGGAGAGAIEVLAHRQRP